MASGAQRTTMAKLNRERKVLEKRHKKAARKEARKRDAVEGIEPETDLTQSSEPPGTLSIEEAAARAG